MSIELETRAAELRRQIGAPSPEEELLIVERQIAAEREAEARAAAEKWLLGNGRAIGSLTSQLDTKLQEVKENPSRVGVEQANEMWNDIRSRFELAEVVARRFPGIKTPKIKSVLPPGRRGLDMVADLTIEAPRRHLFPVVIASDSPKLRDALYRFEAQKWLVGQGSSLPIELAGVIATEVSKVDLSERIARQRAERTIIGANGLVLKT